MWGVVLGHQYVPNSTKPTARENMYAKTQVCFLHYNTRPSSPRFAPATPGHQMQPKERGGSGAREGGVRLLAHSPALSLPAPWSRGRRR